MGNPFWDQRTVTVTGFSFTVTDGDGACNHLLSQIGSVLNCEPVPVALPHVRQQLLRRGVLAHEDNLDGLILSDQFLKTVGHQIYDVS